MKPSALTVLPQEYPCPIPSYVVFNDENVTEYLGIEPINPKQTQGFCVSGTPGGQLILTLQSNPKAKVVITLA